MKLNNIAWLAWAGIFAGSVGLMGACGSGNKTGSTKSASGADSCGNGAVDVGEECDGDMCCNADCTKKAGCTPTSTGTTMGVCGNGKVEAGEQCDDGKNNGMAGDPCKSDCKIDTNNPCGNGKVDAGEECDLGMGNSCADGTAAACTCTCKNKKCGDGVTQAGECCDDANGGGSEQMSKCNATCTGCKNPSDPACPAACKTTTSSSTGPIDCTKAKIFKAVVSNQTNPAMTGGGFKVAWSYKGFLGLQAGKALCQDVGADHVCSYDEIVQAEAKGELAGIPNNLTYWLHRTTNVPDYLQNNGMKTCNTAADCGGADVCDPVTKICSWKPGAGGRCNDWTYTTGHIADGEWFKVLQGTDPGGVTKGTLSFHFLKDTTYDGVTAPVCQNETTLGCAGGCAGPTRAILCCFPKCVP